MAEAPEGPQLWTFRRHSAKRRGKVAQALGAHAAMPSRNRTARGASVQVLVRDNNVDQALKALKKKMQREGIFREMKLRGHYEKPSEKKAREKAEAIRRARKPEERDATQHGSDSYHPCRQPHSSRGAARVSRRQRGRPALRQDCLCEMPQSIRCRGRAQAGRDRHRRH